MSAYDSAVTLATHRMWSVFPVDHPDLPKCAGMADRCRKGQCKPEDRGKHNVVSHTTGADTNPKMIAMWWAGTSRNVGIPMGKNGLLVIDEDKPDAFAKFAADHGVELQPTFTVKTGKGRHYYYQDTQNGELGNAEGALKPYGINVRSGNAYVVGPGSKHFTGHIYTAENNLNPAPLPKWVIEAIKAKAKPTTTDADGTQWETVTDSDRFQLPEVIEDGHRDTTLIQYAGSLLARETPRWEAEILMEAAWKRCAQPPKAKDTYTLHEALEKLNRYDPGRSEGYEKQDPSQIFAEDVEKEARKIRVREAAQRKIRAEQNGPLPPFDAGTLRDMLARPPSPPGRVDGLIPWEASTLIPAQRKTGKTTLLLNLARAFLTGETFLGTFEVQPVDGLVTFLNYEVSGGTIAQWAHEAGLNPDRFFIVNLRGRRNPLADPVDRNRLAQLLRQRGTESLLVDPFGRAYTGQSQNDSSEVGSWLIELDRFTRNDIGAQDLILSTHAGWNQERTRGSSALEDWADSIITMTRDDSEDGNGERYLRAIGRDVDLEEDQLTYDEATRTLVLAGTGSRKAAAQKRKAERNADTLRVAITKLVTEQPGINGSEVERELRNAGVTFQRGEHREVLKALVDEGKLTVEPGKRNAKLYKITQLAQLAQLAQT